MKEIVVKSLDELDALVAEHVFKYQRTEHPDNRTEHDGMLFWHDVQTGRCLIGTAWRNQHHPENTFTHSWAKFLPSSTIAAAWCVVEKLKSEWVISFVEANHMHTCCIMHLSNGRTVEAEGNAMCGTICLCALASVGITVKMEIEL